MSRLTPRDRRALIAASVILTPLLLYSLVVQPYVSSLGDAQDRVVAVRALYGRELAEVALSDSLSILADIQRREEELAAARLFESSGNDTHLELERYVVDMARRQRVSVEMSASHPVDERVEGLQAVQTEISAIGDFNGILNLMYALENGSKLVHIEKMSIRTMHDRIHGEDALAVNLIIYGFRTVTEGETI
jgi:type II secretory pathway component PulM